MFTVLKKFLLLSPIYKYKIQGNSMEPTIAAGETILVNRMAYWFRDPKKNEIIALYDPRDDKILVKRITKKSGTSFFVQGDNKKASTDSRVFGMIGKSAIIGKVIL